MPFGKGFIQLQEGFTQVSLGNTAEAHRLENRRLLVGPPAWPIFCPRIDDSHSNRIHSSLTAVGCFDNGYVGKAAGGLERILCGVLVKGTPGKLL